MTQISGVRKVSHTPGVSGGSGNRFGVKTDQEELLSKVSAGHITCQRLQRNIKVQPADNVAL